MEATISCYIGQVSFVVLTMTRFAWTSMLISSCSTYSNVRSVYSLWDNITVNHIDKAVCYAVIRCLPACCSRSCVIRPGFWSSQTKMKSRFAMQEWRVKYKDMGEVGRGCRKDLPGCQIQSQGLKFGLLEAITKDSVRFGGWIGKQVTPTSSHPHWGTSLLTLHQWTTIQSTTLTTIMATLAFQHSIMCLLHTACIPCLHMPSVRHHNLTGCTRATPTVTLPQPLQDTTLRYLRYVQAIFCAEQCSDTQLKHLQDAIY